MARGEPLDRLVCPFFRAEMIAEHPAIGIHLPTRETVSGTYVTKIDAESTSEITKFFQSITGYICVSFDGATVLHKSKIMYTVSRASTLCSIPTYFGSLAYYTEVEVTDA